jgi:hypothetical protein
MAIILDVVCTDRQLSLPAERQKKVRAIGEILPYVFARYGIRGANVPRLPSQSEGARPRRFQF